MCLGHSALNVRSSHPVFNHPHQVEITWEEQEVPEYFRHYQSGRELGETIKVWRVQTEDGSTDREMGWGIVSSGNGFEDSPDAEVISGGLNSKGPNAVAMARWGNYFHWGWAAPPGKMTEELRKTFINSIHYISEYAGHEPLVYRAAASRMNILDAALQIDEIEKGFARMFADDPDRARQEAEKYMQRHLGRFFPSDIIDRFGRDGQAYYQYYLENLEYITCDSYGSSRHYIDEDVKAWGMSNRDVAILDKAISIIEQLQLTDEHTRAMRILHRYTTKRFPSPYHWRQWFEQNKDKLFFTDVGGYKFMVNPYK